MNLLLISNSTNAGEAYLEYPKPYIKEFLKTEKLNCVFIPFAAVDFSYDEYESKVKQRFEEIGQNLKSVHQFENMVEAVENADVIVVGGGNTFHLLKTIQNEGLVEPIRKKVQAGTPYIGWSAGSNMACPTIRTTNDMPIVEPESFNALNLIDFQINPHYLDANPEGHAGETREQRISEFLAANKDMKVLGLREGTMLHFHDNVIDLKGAKDAILFSYENENVNLPKNSDITNLL
jgi:dipeptidase E